MFTLLFPANKELVVVLWGALVAFILTALLLKKFARYLPTDNGKAYAVEGVASKGKPTGSGVIFITACIGFSLLFIPLSFEKVIFYFLIEAAMLSGFLDDRSNSPWSEYKKGLIDLLIALMTSLTIVVFSGPTLIFPIFHTEVVLPTPLYVLLGTLLVWVAINATNCTDGVDGLSASVSITSLLSILLFAFVTEIANNFSSNMLLMVVVLIAYLWFNTNPSRLLMGDAGSRAIGVFLAIAVMKSGQPFLYLVVCLVFLVDGMAGILKISLKRFLKIDFLKNTLTPIHDHLRKRLGWSNPQVTIRLTIIQGGISCLYLLAVLSSR